LSKNWSPGDLRGTNHLGDERRAIEEARIAKNAAAGNWRPYSPGWTISEIRSDGKIQIKSPDRLPATPEFLNLLTSARRPCSLAEFSERAISLWISIREASYRREGSTIESHCRQIRILTLGAFETVKALSGGAKAGAQ
jgi:hypothetical protein